jgi:hypothetical protein
MSRIHVHIDRVILKGIEAPIGNALIDGLRGELSRALSNPAAQVGAKYHCTPVIRLGRISMEPGTFGGRRLGIGMARAIERSVMP